MLYKRILALSALLCVLIANSALAGIIETKQVESKVYFLSESPNKIMVYDLDNKTFEEEIALSATPTAFTVTEDVIYIGYGRVLKWISLDDNVETYIRNTVENIETMATSEDRLFLIDASEKLTTLNLNSFHSLYTQSVYSGSTNRKLTYSSGQQALYVRNGDNTIRKFELNEEGKVLRTLSQSRSYNENKYTDYVLNPFENTVHVNIGKSLIAFDLSLLPKTPSFDYATFAKANLVGCDQDKFVVYNQVMEIQHEQLLTAGCDGIAYYSGNVFVFDYSNVNAVQADYYDVSELHLVEVGESHDPEFLNFQYDLVETGLDNIVYLYDRETLSLYRWSLTDSKYLESISLKKPITSMAMDVNNSPF